MKIKIWEMALCAALAVTLFVGLGAQREQQELSEKLIRLHVVANSDSDEDQTLKLKVRDGIIATLESTLDGAENKADAAQLIAGSLDDLRASAQQTLRENGSDYAVNVSLKQELFPTRDYDTFSLPAGVYDSLRVEIGEAEGRNWWCVVFPPVCASQNFTQEYAKTVGLTDSEYRLITDDGGECEVRFRLLELIGWIRGLFAK